MPYPDRRTGTGLYAFVETKESEDDLNAFVAAGVEDMKIPEIVQIVDALPRRPSGDVRTEILTLVAMNQIDLIDPLIVDDVEREIVEQIVAGRQNLRDRFAF